MIKYEDFILIREKRNRRLMIIIIIHEYILYILKYYFITQNISISINQSYIIDSYFSHHFFFFFLISKKELCSFTYQLAFVPWRRS